MRLTKNLKWEGKMQISLEKKSNSSTDRKLENITTNSLLKNESYKLTSQNRRWNPPTDVFETTEKVIVRIEIAGMSEDDFEIIFDKNILTISGTRVDSIQSQKIFHQMEVVYGDFFSGIEINIPLEIDNAQAKYENGYLIITINKAMPKTIKIGK